MFGYSALARSTISPSTFGELPMNMHRPPLAFSRPISNSKRSQPAMRSTGCDFAPSQRHAFTMLAPSGISASPPSNASANLLSSSAVLYECALIVLISSFPSGSAASSRFDSTSFRFFKRNSMIMIYSFSLERRLSLISLSV